MGSKHHFQTPSEQGAQLFNYCNSQIGSLDATKSHGKIVLKFQFTTKTYYLRKQHCLFKLDLKRPRQQLLLPFMN